MTVCDECGVACIRVVSCVPLTCGRSVSTAVRVSTRAHKPSLVPEGEPLVFTVKGSTWLRAAINQDGTLSDLGEGRALPLGSGHAGIMSFDGGFASTSLCDMGYRFRTR